MDELVEGYCTGNPKESYTEQMSPCGSLPNDKQLLGGSIGISHDCCLYQSVWQYIPGPQSVHAYFHDLSVPDMLV